MNNQILYAIKNLEQRVVDLYSKVKNINISSAGDLQAVTTQGNETTNNVEFNDGAKIIFDNGSRLQKGTTNSETGGNGGIAQVCSIDYELKWEAGRLYTLQQDGFTIREVSHNFTLTPGVNDDFTRGFVEGSRWILDNGDIYVCTDNTTENAVWELQLSTALVFLDEGNGNGIVRTDRDNAHMGNIGLDAVDLSFWEADDPLAPDTGDYGATGEQALALGYAVKASGYATFINGAYSNGNGSTSFLNGYYHNETGVNYANFLTGAGHSVTNGAYATIVGQFANVVSNNINDVNDGSNTMFAVGNGRATEEGTLLERGTAFQVYRDGRIVAPTLTTALINADTTGKMVATKEYVDSKKPYKVYTVLLSQSGTSAPTAIVLENTIGNIVWSSLFYS